MTTTSESLEAEAPEPSPRRSLSPRRLVVVAVAGIVLVGLLVAGRWWTTPDVFPDSGAGLTVVPRPVSRAALTVGVTSPYADEQAEPTGLTFTDEAAVRLSTDSAEAEVDVAVCRATPGAELIGSVSAGDVGDYCDEVVPVTDGVRMSRGPWIARERDYVIVTLTPTTPGRVRLVEVSLPYRTDGSRLYRRGTDTIGLDVRVPATADRG